MAQQWMTHATLRLSADGADAALERTEREWTWEVHWTSKNRKRDLEMVVGHMTHYAMVRRELLCIFHTLYRFIQKCYWVRERLWPSVQAEIRAFMGAYDSVRQFLARRLA